MTGMTLSTFPLPFSIMQTHRSPEKNDQDFLAIDLGRVNPGDQIPQFNFEIHNLPAPFGEELTASLDLVSIDIIPAESSLSISGPAFENLAAGESVQFAISGVADELGTFTTNFVILLFDEDLPGAMSETIELSVSYEVVVKNIGTDNSCDGNAQYFDAVGWCSVTEALFSPMFRDLLTCSFSCCGLFVCQQQKRSSRMPHRERAQFDRPETPPCWGTKSFFS